MSALIRSSIVVVVLAVAVPAGWAQAENEGQEDLDQATEAKLTANTISDLDDVIRLCETALEKGLDEGNAKFANTLLASTLVQRGSERAKLLLRTPPQHPDRPKFRQAALDDLERALKLNPKQPRALFMIARLNYLPGGDSERAGIALDQAIEASGDQPGLRAEALVLRAAVVTDEEQKMAALDEAVRVAPRYAPAHRVRGLLRAQMGKLELALADLDKAIELSPRHVPTYEAKAEVLRRLKKYDEALISLDKAHELNPRSVTPLIQKAQIHALQENLDAALIDLNLAHSIDSDNVGVLLARAGVYREMDQKEKALGDVDRVLELRPEFVPAMRTRAVLLAEVDRLEEAIAELEKLRKLDPKDMPVLLQLGMFCNAAKEFGRAIETYSGALTKEPDNPLALRGRGDSLLNIGKHAEAIADYEKAVKGQPKDAGLLNNLAWVLATSPVDELRDGKRAVELASEACKLTDYKQAHILSTLAAAYAETGDFDSAVKWAEKGIEVGNEQQQKPLQKELESYHAKNPWRELLSEGEPAP